MYNKIIWNVISIIISIIISGIIGTIVGFSAFVAVILGIMNAIVVALAIGVITLAGIIFLTIFENTRRCLCSGGIFLAIASIGLIITSLILIATSVIPGFIITAVLIGIAAFFLTFILIEVLKMTIRLIKKGCCRRE